MEQQLEAPLKALWPSVYLSSRGNVVTPNPVTFLSTTQQGTLGHGDQPAAVGGNLGFLRSDRLAGLSLLVIVVVTDEDDCSPRTTDFLAPPDQLDSNSAFKTEDINLRCHYNQDKLYDLAARYYQGFTTLRPSNPELVMFAAIAGVPVDLVNSDARSAVDFSDATQRDAYYDGILSDPRMLETVDPATNPGSGTGNLLPSCNGIDGTGHEQVGYPAVRITTLAKMFKGNAVLQSICDGDMSAPMDTIIDAIAVRAGTKIACQ